MKAAGGAGTGVTGLRDALVEALSEGLSARTLARAAAAAYETDTRVSALGDLLREWTPVAKAVGSEEGEVARGYFHFLRGEFAVADGILSRQTATPWGAVCALRTKLAMGRVADAEKLVKSLGPAAAQAPVAYAHAEVLCHAGKETEALALIDRISAPQDSEWVLARAGCLESAGEWREAIDAFRRASELDPKNANAFFRLGFLLDLYGDESAGEADEAVRAYEACLRIVPLHTNAIVNLGLIYEDRERCHDAAKCYETVLRVNPNHRRAKLYLGDALAATRMFYDRDQEKKADRHSQVLKIPVTDFELSVRSRNCLQKMNIASLGDLIMRTEQELLSYKNFGETSLKEIKEMLSQKNLRLGQGLEERGREPPSGRNPLEATAPAEVLDKPIEDLNLSVRSRRCMERLDVRVLRDLINKTEVELMSAKNFGMTSLNEIKRKLGELGLSLRS